MAKARLTKYGEDEFVLRMSRDNAMRILGIFAYTSIGSSLLKDDDIPASKSLYDDFAAVMKQDVSQEEFEKGQFVPNDASNELIKLIRVVPRP